MTQIGTTRVGATTLNKKRIAGISAAILVVGFGGWMAMRNPAQPPAAKNDGAQPLRYAPAQPLPDRAKLEEAAYSPPPTPRTRVEETQKQAAAQTNQPLGGGQTRQQAGRPGGGQRKKTLQETLDEQARDAGVGGWEDEKFEERLKIKVAASPAGRNDFKKSACAGLGFVRPGTPIQIQIINAVNTERGGIVTGQVTRSVFDSASRIEPIPAGTTVVADYDTQVSKGQKRIAIGNPVFTRPWPRDDELEIKGGMVATRDGSSGIPGDVDYPYVAAGLLVAANVGLELGKAVLSSGGTLIGSIFAEQADNPLEKAAKDLLDRAPTISLDAGEQVILFLRSGICADDFQGQE